MQGMQIWSLCQEDLEEGTATHFPTSVFCLESPHGQRSLAGYIVHEVEKNWTWFKWLSTHTLESRRGIAWLGCNHRIQLVNRRCADAWGWQGRNSLTFSAFTCSFPSSCLPLAEPNEKKLERVVGKYSPQRPALEGTEQRSEQEAGGWAEGRLFQLFLSPLSRL